MTIPNLEHHLGRLYRQLSDLINVDEPVDLGEELRACRTVAASLYLRVKAERIRRCPVVPDLHERREDTLARLNEEG